MTPTIVKYLMQRAIDAHRPIFNGEVQATPFQKQEAKRAIETAHHALDELVKQLKKG